MNTPQQRCRNCGSPLRGRFCSECGQRELGEELRFSHLLRELGGDVLNWDSRFWRTLLPLLFRPGYLTAEFMAGRRARYVPPLRLYLVVSFILFLALSLGSGFAVTVDSDADPEGVVAGLTLESGAKAPQGTDDGAPTGDLSPENSALDERGVETIDFGLADEHSEQWLQDLEQHLNQRGQQVAADPNVFLDQLLEHLPQMMFLLLPLFALLLWFCYLGSAYHYLQHLVFALHYHSFVYLLFLLAMAVEAVGVHGDGWLILCLAIYLPLALLAAYGGSRLGAVLRATVLYISYLLVLGMGFAGLFIAMLALG